MIYYYKIVKNLMKSIKIQSKNLNTPRSQKSGFQA
jgi:hypothetical protein